MTAHYSIHELLCVECGQCRRFCPVAGAIRIDERYQHVIVQDVCSGCGICEAFCPVPGALVRQNALPNARKLITLRRVVWRKQWQYHHHPLMGKITGRARWVLQTFHQLERASGYPAASTVSNIERMTA
jgi:Pyruvate/2-oxoacid:ferredoxin oxidoreductase delta subunit